MIDPITIAVGLVFYSAVAAVGIRILVAIITVLTRKPEQPMHRSMPVCIASREGCMTGMYGPIDTHEYVPGGESNHVSVGRGGWHNAPEIPLGRPAPHVHTTHGDEWDYPVEIPEPQPTPVEIPGIRVDNWPGKR